MTVRYFRVLSGDEVMYTIDRVVSVVRVNREYYTFYAVTYRDDHGNLQTVDIPHITLLEVVE